MSDPDDLALAAEFPAASRAQWLKLVERLLKGAPLETLAAKTADGLTIAPLYPRAHEVASIAARRPRWQVMAQVDHPNPAAANAQALEDLNGGANGLVLVGANSVGAHGYGLLPALDTIEQMLDGVHLDAGITMEFELGAQTMQLPLAFAILVGGRAIAPESVDVRFGFDPLGEALTSGGCQFTWDMFGQTVGRLADEFVSLGFRRSLMVADGRIVHGAGGTEAHELAYVVAAAIAYLRALEAAGIALDDARRMIFFRLTADGDQFLTIAKFRALRTLWARIEESCGLAPEPAFIAAETAWRTMTRHDPHMNILRATIAAFAAGIGGADAITVMPFTAARGLPDAFARRIARNTGLILLDEANVARVTDPTAGTGWSEHLTDQLCRAAWALLQEIEAAGGASAAIAQGLIQHKVAAARAARERAVATRGIALIGANEFSELGEAPVAVLDVARVILPAMPTAVAVEPLPQIRLAEPYEALRDVSDRILATRGARPKVFLANLGPPADFSERANFAKNFFAAGGIEAVTNDGFASREAMVAAFTASGATFACLCGSDAVYARDAANAATALRAAGARRLFIAAEPGKVDYRQADTFIHVGCDALSILQATL